MVESGGKPPFDGVIFLPGLLCDERLFAPQVDSLAAVVNSAGEQLYPTEVAHLGDYDSIESMAQAVFENTRFERFALVGLSMGGALAMNMARMAPQRVERMALFDANPGTDDERRRANRRRQLAEATRVGVGEFTRRELIDLYLAPDSRTPELVDLTVAMAERHGIATYERQLQALMNRSDSRRILLITKGVRLCCVVNSIACVRPPCMKKWRSSCPILHWWCFPGSGIWQLLKHRWRSMRRCWSSCKADRVGGEQKKTRRTWSDGFHTVQIVAWVTDPGHQISC